MSPSHPLTLPGYWERLAHRVEQEPACLDVVLQTIDRWLADGHSAPHRLTEWRRLILAAQQGPNGMQILLTVMTSDDPADVRLRDFTPFAGILTREERRNTKELCGYRH
jgi:hypothetical protein